ncbi:25218_t:CDS:1, partial [Gigaspora rosea]
RSYLLPESHFDEQNYKMSISILYEALKITDDLVVVVADR